jgi:hypothetical protein
MEVNTAVEIAESLGANLVYDDALKLFTIYFGEAYAYVKPQDLETASEDGYKAFLVKIISHEAAAIHRFGITRH